MESPSAQTYKNQATQSKSNNTDISTGIASFDSRDETIVADDGWGAASVRNAGAGSDLVVINSTPLGETGLSTVIPTGQGRIIIENNYRAGLLKTQQGLEVALSVSRPDTLTRLELVDLDIVDTSLNLATISGPKTELFGLGGLGGISLRSLGFRSFSPDEDQNGFRNLQMTCRLAGGSSCAMVDQITTSIDHGYSKGQSQAVGALSKVVTQNIMTVASER